MAVGAPRIGVSPAAVKTSICASMNVESDRKSLTTDNLCVASVLLYRAGSTGSVQGFTISLRVDGSWRTVYRSDAIGGSFGVILPDVYTADSIRLDFQRWKGRISINQINAYGAPQTQSDTLRNAD